jgi:thermitase
VEPNFLLQAADTLPNDPSWGLQYGLANIRAPQGWDLSTGSAAVTIAIVDTGVDYAHPDLAGKLTSGYDFVNNDDIPQDDNGHGTHVAGIAAASSNNATGVAGVSWGARIMPVKVLNASGGGSYANTADGVIWAVDHGAQVINLSLGGTGPSALLEDAINYAYSRGAVVVAAAGNTGSNFVLYPARYPNAIAVARTNSANNWDGSSFGPEVDLSAPGTLIFSTVVGGYDYNSGSSMSTGFVSGLAAILIGIPGNGSPGAIKSQMESTALDIEFAGWDEYTGAGLIQMDAAIREALPPTNPPENSANPSINAGSGPIQVAPTSTPTPTWTVSPILPSQEFTLTFTHEAGSTIYVTETITGASTEEESEVKAQGDSGNNFVLPCIGILFIVLGLFLVWFFKRKQQVIQ